MPCHRCWIDSRKKKASRSRWPSDNHSVSVDYFWTGKPGLAPGFSVDTRTAASGRKRTLISPNFCRSERPLSGKAAFREWTENFHKIDQLGTSAIRPEADIRLERVQRSANDLKRTWTQICRLLIPIREEARVLTAAFLLLRDYAK